MTKINIGIEAHRTFLMSLQHTRWSQGEKVLAPQISWPCSCCSKAAMQQEGQTQMSLYVKSLETRVLFLISQWSSQEVTFRTCWDHLVLTCSPEQNENRCSYRLHHGRGSVWLRSNLYSIVRAGWWRTASLQPTDLENLQLSLLAWISVLFSLGQKC